MSELFARVAAETKPEAEEAGQGGLWAPAPAQAHNDYRVLARKYRPTDFSQLIGQEAMVRTLTNAIESGRLPHAWMLTGVRGIGKTTTARIIARALNCTGADGKGGPTVTPCGQCDSCKAIAEDRHVDVLEMDAASRTGVDDIRDIIDGVRYGPASARYKIYILDEVHMLSKNAFNALLKTLEEPPPHTKFIFATTEIRKVPVTVLSRCQRFDLRRIDSAALAAHFAEVAAKENVTAEEEAINLIAHAADGSVRDGLSLLDQAIARGDGKVMEADVKDMLGLADRGQSIALCRQILRGEMKPALESFSAMQQAGSDPLQVLQDMCDCVHLLSRAQAVPDFAGDKTLPEYDRAMLVELADIRMPALARAWQILLKGIGEVQNAPHPADAAEMVLIRLAYAAELPPPADLVRQLRETIGADSAASSPVSASPPGGAPRAKIAVGGATALAPAIAKQAIPQAEAAPLASPTGFRELVALFAEKREGTLHAQLYANVHPVRCEPGLLEIHVGAHAPANLAAQLGKCLGAWTGKRWMVSLTDKQGEPSLAEQDKQAEKARHEKALSHPLMQAALQAFPGAKLVSLRQKQAATPAVSDTAPADDMMADDAPMMEPEDDS
ncbi:MAG TPA: DNA polymerase III subunit gamma/tau [Alphaproteobacteria bacterium]|nr:DNA polymerase III subunit gamma/tau [Alphaproteobacteria bacterium]